MKKYSICLLLFLAASAVCIAAGFAAAKYQKAKQERIEQESIMEQSASEELMASSEEEEEMSAEPAGMGPENKYYLVCEDGFLLVFCRDKSTVCLYTHVPITDFPEEEQGRLRAGIWFSSMMDIFSYLESYTS